MIAGQALQFFYAQIVPRRMESLLFLFIYGISLLISSLVLYFALKSLGVTKGFIQDFPKALFTSFIRDLVIGPIILIIYYYPIIGILAGFIVWFGLVKYIFQTTWIKALMSWLVAGLIYLIIMIFILLPIAFIYIR